MQIGGLTGDRYKLLECLGSGCFGDAWKAHDQDEDDVVVVKLLDPGTKPDDVLREARLHRRLSSHPRVVGMRNVELGGAPSSFVVLDLREQGSLEARLARGLPTVREIQRWLIDTLEALSHAHGLGVLHRDIKPSNLLIDGNDHVCLTDFGVAEDSVRQSANLDMYRATMPPEFPATDSSPQTDLWLVGILGWQMAVGRRPDREDAYAGRVPLAHRERLDLPIALARAIATGLKVDPNERPLSAGRMLEAVSAVRVAASWSQLPVSRPGEMYSWEADDHGGRVGLAVRKKRDGQFEIVAKAPTGSRLRARRHVVVPTLAMARKQARAWLLDVVDGRRL